MSIENPEHPTPRKQEVSKVEPEKMDGGMTQEKQGSEKTENAIEQAEGATEPERKALDDVRERLGLRPINTEKTAAGQQEHSPIRAALRGVEGSFSSLGNRLKAREGSQLSSLLSKNDIARISFGLRTIAETASDLKIDYTKIIEGAAAIRRGFDAYASYSRLGPVRESVESLAAISAAIQSTRENVINLRASIVENTDNGAVEAAAAANALASRLQEVWLITARKRQALSRF